MFSMQRQVLILAVTGLLIITTLLATSRPSFTGTTTGAKGAQFPTAPGETTGKTRRLHLLLPVTAPNLDFCRFLLSSTIAGYPDPILVGWGHEESDGKVSHLFKVFEGLAYLNSLPKEQDDDLVLMLDGYDIWMLLRPEVIISRYNKIMAEQAGWLKEQGILGKHNRDVPVENTLLFGADKVCWPRMFYDAGCWSVPESPMRKQEYGPDTDSWMVLNRPRWLNSGTLIGPAGHMRDLFNATLENIHRTYDESYVMHDSDQHYFTDVWAEQELTRMLLRDGKISAPVVGKDESGADRRGKIPDIPADRRTEQRLSLDYGIDLFQTAAGFTEFLTWMSFNNTTPYTSDEKSKRRRIDQLELPDDIQRSKHPFETRFPVEGLPSEKGWKDVRLGVNTVQQTVWPLFHVTGDKDYRDRWWHYLWFHPYGKALLRDAAIPAERSEPEVLAVVDGVKYIAADTSKIRNAAMPGGRGGGWSDGGERFEWDGLCGQWENDPMLWSN